MKVDEKFFDRADEHIHLSNKQLENAPKGEVSASMMYGLTRFNAWVSATGWTSAKEMEEAKEKTLTYFVDEYKRKLEANLEDYIKNFDYYMKNSAQSS